MSRPGVIGLALALGFAVGAALQHFADDTTTGLWLRWDGCRWVPDAGGDHG